MIFAIRADAGVVQGTGHVMRCLSLAEKLIQKGHRVGLFTNSSEIAWLESVISASGVEVFRVTADELSTDQLAGFPADWLIVDSYQIPAEQISAVNQELRVLAIVDGDSRGITASESTSNPYAITLLRSSSRAPTRPQREHVSSAVQGCQVTASGVCTATRGGGAGA